MIKIKRIWQKVKKPFLFWVLASVFCSAMKSYEPYNDTSNCGKTYPVDYIVYTDLFCEVEP